jgi:hypothetical protein
MNAPARISQHDQQKASYRLARANIEAAAKLHTNTNKPAPVKRTGPIGKHLYEEPIEHCRMWKVWRVMMGEKVQAAEYIRLSCYLAGVPHKTLLSASRKRALVKIRKGIIRDVAAIYRHLSYPQIGNLFNLDHTTIIFHLFGRGGAIRDEAWNAKVASRTRVITALTEADVRHIRSTFNDSMTKEDVARKYGVSAHCIRMVLQRKTWKHIE